MKSESCAGACLAPEMLEQLRRLCACGSTPGDERQLGLLVASAWRDAGWQPECLGRYAIFARSPEWLPDRPTVMICAHLDSPGFIVDGVDEAQCEAHCVPLGHPHEPDEDVPVCLRGRDGAEYAGLLCDHAVIRSERLPQLGDRVWFAPQFQLEDELLRSPFLDNRVGCWALCQLSARLGRGGRQQVNVILAATGQEEMTGFGAAVLANRVQADLVVCLDATYANEGQSVRLGGGSVLTVSDKSTLQSPETVSWLTQLFASWQLPLSLEVYNYSGTDASAFPKAGVASPVLALLLPTEGNHSPVETCHVADLASYVEMCACFGEDGAAVRRLCRYWHGWLEDDTP